MAQESGQQHDVADSLKAQNDAVRGTGEQFPELSQPHLVLASPAGIETTSAESTHIASGEHIALTAGRSLSLAVGDSLFASIKQTLRLFVHKAGMKLIAASGKITVQAHDDDIQLIANKVLSLISQTDWIDIRGKKGVRLHGPGAMVEITDRMQVFAPKPALFHGNLETLAPQNRPQPSATEVPPVEPTPEQLYFQMQSHAVDGLDCANVPYSLYQGDTKIEDGITDESGGLVVSHKTGTQDYSVQLASGDRMALNVVPKLAPSSDPLHREQAASNRGIRGLEAAIDKFFPANGGKNTHGK
ncbi:MAG: type secretion system tip protein VgrG [Massilia sp.]|nr:type secretion system tip protein VgrG [Massilia sp.]